MYLNFKRPELGRVEIYIPKYCFVFHLVGSLRCYPHFMNSDAIWLCTLPNTTSVKSLNHFVYDLTETVP